MPPEPAAKGRKAQIGSARPRLAPPAPVRSDVAAIREVAQARSIPMYPWQDTGARYIEARGPSGPLWPEVAVIVGRRNGKTSLLENVVISRMRRGRRVMHTAQNRDLPRSSHEVIADAFQSYWPGLVDRIRWSSGQEEIVLKNGGHYKIVAPTRSAARGHTNDVIVIDEILDLEDHEFIGAAKPTVMASPEAQVLYFSNAGTPMSAVLNALKLRADSDPSLAYLEWSAPPDAEAGDVRAWLQANPAVGHNPALLPNLEREYRAHLLGNTLSVWEREYLCRWTATNDAAPFITQAEWDRQTFGLDEPDARIAYLGIKTDPDGRRSSAVLAWPRERGIGLEVIADVTGDPIDVERYGADLVALAVRRRVREVAFDPYTDEDLARYLRNAKPLQSRVYAQASDKFMRLVLACDIAVRGDGAALAADLQHTIRVGGANGAYVATKDSPEATNTAAEAAIRAAWLASAPQPRVVVY